MRQLYSTRDLLVKENVYINEASEATTFVYAEISDVEN